MSVGQILIILINYGAELEVNLNNKWKQVYYKRNTKIISVILVLVTYLYIWLLVITCVHEAKLFHVCSSILDINYWSIYDFSLGHLENFRTFFAVLKFNMLLNIYQTRPLQYRTIWKKFSVL